MTTFEDRTAFAAKQKVLFATTDLCHGNIRKITHLFLHLVLVLFNLKKKLFVNECVAVGKGMGSKPGFSEPDSNFI